MSITDVGDAGSARSEDRTGDSTLLGRKSVLMGLAASMGLVLADAALPTVAAAGTVKPIAVTQPAYVPRWTPNTVYARGQQVISSNNDVVSANVAHTSSAAYVSDTAKWVLSSTYAPVKIAAVNPLTGMVHVDAFGAVGDGVNDDTAAIQSALDYAAGFPGSTVQLQAKTYKTTDTLTINNVNLVGTGGVVFDRLNPDTRMGTTITPVIATADKAAIKTTKANRGVTLANLTVDMYGMADGSTDSPYTRSQTKGIHLDGSWYSTLKQVVVHHVPSKAAGVFIDDAIDFGAYWTRLDGVFVSTISKKAKANGRLLESTALTEAMKDTTARGICLAGNRTDPSVTAVTMIDTTTYRGFYAKNVSQLEAVNFHSEDSPLHNVELNGGDHLTFKGGFFEKAGSEKAVGDGTTYLICNAANAPRLVCFDRGSYCGSGFDYSQYGVGLDVVGDQYSQPAGDRYRIWGDLKIDRAGVAQFSRNVDVRAIGPHTTTNSPANSETVLAVYTGSPVAYDPMGLVTGGGTYFNFLKDPIEGATYKVEVHYSFYVVGWSTVFATEQFADVKLKLAGVVQSNGNALTSIRHRHFLLPGNTSQLVEGTYSFSVKNCYSGYFQLVLNHNRADGMKLGLGNSDDDRGCMTYRILA